MNWTSPKAILIVLLITATAAFILHLTSGPVNDPIPRLLALL